MKHAKHTPGPWIVDSTDNTHFIGANDGDYTVSQIERAEEGPLERATSEANARLIASAPDLLEALQLVMRLNPGAVYFNGRDGEMYLEWEAAFNVIAKATGGTK